jgi:hypothetical protein
MLKKDFNLSDFMKIDCFEIFLDFSLKFSSQVAILNPINEKGKLI